MTGVQTCALPIWIRGARGGKPQLSRKHARKSRGHTTSETPARRVEWYLGFNEVSIFPSESWTDPHARNGSNGSLVRFRINIINHVHWARKLGILYFIGCPISLRRSNFLSHNPPNAALKSLADSVNLNFQENFVFLGLQSAGGDDVGEFDAPSLVYSMYSERSVALIRVRFFVTIIHCLNSSYYKLPFGCTLSIINAVDHQLFYGNSTWQRTRRVTELCLKLDHALSFLIRRHVSNCFAVSPLKPWSSAS